MPIRPRLVSLWRILFHKERVEQELKEETQAYLELLIETKIEAGAGPAEARRAALIEMGGLEQVKERVREARMGRHLETLWQDVRYAVRSLRKHALLSIAVITTLTLGIGVSVGVFTYYNAVYARPRVDKDFYSFVKVYSAYSMNPTRTGEPGGTTLEDFLAFRDRAKSLHDLAAFSQMEALFGEGEAIEVRALLVTPNFFSLYNLERPRIGRLFEPEDYTAANPVVVLSERLWRNRFASDPQIVGKVIHYNGQPVTVVGVTPNFAGMLSGTRAWFPYTLQTYLKRGSDLLRPGESAWLEVEGRLNPGFSRREAAEELRLLAGQQDRLHPGRTTTLTVTDGSMMQEPKWRYIVTWGMSLILVGVTTLVLIVCANITTLLLARAAARRQEIAVRLALGAGRMRIVRMLLIETLLMASVAGLASLYIAYHVPRLLALDLQDGFYDIFASWSLAPDRRVFGYLTLVTLLAGTIAGLTPALESLKINLSETLKGRHGLPGGAGGGSRLRGILIGAQVTLSFFLLYFAWGAVRVHQRISTFEPGFETRQVLLAHLSMRGRPAERQSWSTFRRALAQRIEAMPGVQSVTYASQPPYNNRSMLEVQIPGQAMRKVAMNYVSPRFFVTLGIPIVSGRELQEGDPPCGKGLCPVVVSQRHAREFWPGEDPLGKTLRDPQGNSYEVVGVAHDVSSQQLGGLDGPLLYLTWNPESGPGVHDLYVRFSGNSAPLARAVTGAVREMAPEISVRAETIEKVREWLIADFGRTKRAITLPVAVAVLLAAIGIYGVVAFAVAQRAKEIGIRIALGAGKRDIYSVVLKYSARPVVAGILIGVALTLATTMAAAEVLRRGSFALNIHDPIAYASAVILLAAVALAAALWPARRATQVDPMIALREE